MVLIVMIICVSMNLGLRSLSVRGTVRVCV